MGGDGALFELSEKFDKVHLDSITVDEDAREAVYEQVDTRITECLVEAEVRISRFHELQMPRELWLSEVEPGITLGVKTTPLSRVGAYVPGGRAAYPSTALMCTIPARIAGVPEICCCSPPPIQPLTLVALDIAGVNEIYQCGGAQAIAAMALGTETIEPVDKIVGPGNVYVTSAKMMLREYAEIDFPALTQARLPSLPMKALSRSMWLQISSHRQNMILMQPASLLQPPPLLQIASEPKSKSR